MADIAVYEGAKLPEVVIQFVDGAGSPLDFGPSDTAAFYLRSTDFEGDLTMIIDGAPMSISEADNPLGITRYFWRDEDLPLLTPGFYYAVAEAIVDGKPWREPREGWLLVEVVAMLKADMSSGG